MATGLKATSRRAFIARIGSAGVAAVAGYHAYKLFEPEMNLPTRGSIVYGGEYRVPPTSIDEIRRLGFDAHTKYTENYLYRLDLLSGKIDEVPSQTPAHSTEPHPIDRSLVACIAKRTDRISLFDWNLKKEISSFVPKFKECFHGHACFSDDGKLLLVSGFDFGRSVAQGLLYLFEVPTLKLTDVIEMGEYDLHEFVRIGPNRYVCGLHGEAVGQANFGTIDLGTKSFQHYSRAFENVKVPFLINHIDAVVENAAYALCNSIDDGKLTAGTLARFDLQSHEIKFEFPLGTQRTDSELLSLKVDAETGYAWLTVPDENVVVVWDVKNERLISILEGLETPRSIVLSPSIDAMIIGSRHGLKAYDRKRIANLSSIDSKWQRPQFRHLLAPHSRLA